MIKNPVAAPLKTSIEFIVFPTNGIAISINGIYNNGINTFPKITFNWLSYAWNTIIGIEANIKAAGLNHPGIILKSSINPTTNAIAVVITMPIISLMPVIKNSINSPAIMLNNKTGPPGLGTIGLFGLWLSFTTFPFETRNLIKIGITISVIRKETRDAIIENTMNS